LSRQYISMKTNVTIGSHIRTLREEAKMPLRKLASILDIDQSTLSKIERDERKSNLQLIEHIAELFKVDKKDLLISFYSDIVCYEIEDELNYSEILKVAETKIEYNRSLKIKNK
jgi:transcriptional regulator with XRE-family HTH domain